MDTVVRVVPRPIVTTEGYVLLPLAVRNRFLRRLFAATFSVSRPRIPWRPVLEP